MAQFRNTVALDFSCMKLANTEPKTKYKTRILCQKNEHGPTGREDLPLTSCVNPDQTI